MQHLKTFALVAALAMVVPPAAVVASDESGCQGESILPSNWRLPTASELTDEQCGVPKGGTGRVQAKIDSDNLLDTAVIVKAVDESKVAVLVHLSSSGSTSAWLVLEQLTGKCIGFGLRVVEPGTLDGWYCEGVDSPCDAPTPRRLRTTTASLLVYSVASSGVTYVWDSAGETLNRLYSGD